jgi:hypothetical protein
MSMLMLEKLKKALTEPFSPCSFIRTDEGVAEKRFALPALF